MSIINTITNIASLSSYFAAHTAPLESGEKIELPVATEEMGVSRLQSPSLTVVYGSRRLVVETITQKSGVVFYTVQAWRGKAAKSYEYVRINNATGERNSVESYLLRTFKAEDQTIVYKAEQKASDAKRAAEFRDKIKVGTLLVNSWGYDQTNVDFYEVVSVKGATCMIRPIAGETVEATGHMSAKVKAVPGKYTGEAIKKVIGRGGISAEHGSMSITEEGKGHYCSWYH